MLRRRSRSCSPSRRGYRDIFNHSSVRSHLLKPGIASFSVITGSNTTISRNHTQKAATQSKVNRSVESLGDAGSGLNCCSSVTAMGTGNKGTDGSGLE